MPTSAADVDVDVVVVGGGPAGLAAAGVAAGAGTVALVDAGGELGGQYWRRPADGGPVTAHLYHGLDRAEAARARVDSLGVRVLRRHHVQTIAPVDGGWVLHCVVGADPTVSGRTVRVRGRRVVVATGTHDRVLPFPGWTRPGVMTAGGVQALLKSTGVVAGSRVVVAGSGPLLLPVAAGLLAAGAAVPAVVESANPLHWATQLPAAVSAGAKLGEAAGYARRLAAGRTRLLSRSAVVEAIGTDRVTGVRVARLDGWGHPVPGSEREVACDVLAVGWGFTAQLDLALQAGCATHLGADGGLALDVDADQRTTVPGVWAAGEVTGIGGADLSEVEGEIAGLTATGRRPGRRLLARRTRLRRFAAAVHAVYPFPTALLDDLRPDTVVCRCEEVTAAEVAEAREVWGATDVRSVKGLTRTGMGWCQGRICGPATCALVTGTPRHDDLLVFARRPNAVPSPLHTVADLEPSD